LWASLLLSLSHEECYRLTTTWEEVQTEEQQEGVASQIQSREEIRVRELCQELLTPAVDGITPLEVREKLRF
jgi:hypothetical protein